MDLSYDRPTAKSTSSVCRSYIYIAASRTAQQRDSTGHSREVFLVKRALLVGSVRFFHSPSLLFTVLYSRYNSAPSAAALRHWMPQCVGVNRRTRSLKKQAYGPADLDSWKRGSAIQGRKTELWHSIKWSNSPLERRRARGRWRSKVRLGTLAAVAKAMTGWRLLAVVGW